MTNTAEADRGPSVALRVLGAPEVWVGRRRECPPAGRCVWLLGGLAIAPGHVVSERRLAEFIWGVRGTSTSSLRSAVSRLRAWLREVSGDALAVEYLNHGYRLRAAEGVRVDTAEFRSLLAAAERQQDAQRLETLAAALDLWRGPVLDGAPDALGQCAEAKFLRRDRFLAANALVEAATSAGRMTAAVEPLWRLAADEPFDVATQALLMRTLGLAGLSSQIAQAFAVAERRFREEVRIAVPVKLVEAYRSAIVVASSPLPDMIMQCRAAGDRAAGAENRAACSPPRVLTVPGPAEAQYPLLWSHLDPDGRAAGQAPGVLLAGAAGSGKTALAAKAARAVAEAGRHRVLWASMDATTAADEVVCRFLLALGVPADQVPRSAPLRADALRDRLDEVPTAMFLDGPPTARQIVPLIPGTSRSRLVVITAHPALNLPGFTRIDLAPPVGARPGTGSAAVPAAGRTVLRCGPDAVRGGIPPFGPVLVSA